MSNLQEWKFDIGSSIITIIVIPILLSAFILARKYLQNYVNYAVEGLFYWAGRFLKRSLAGTLTLKRYCRLKLAEENRYLLVPSSLDIKLEIDRAFVPLELDQQNNNGVIYSHLNILTVGNRIRVIGDPGSGKSTLIKRLFRDACYLALKKPSLARIPILIELKNLTVPGDKSGKELGDWFVKMLEISCTNSKVYQMQECFNVYAENTGLIIFLDGLDEVAANAYNKVQKAIVALNDKLAQMSDNNILILTMRTQFHQQVKDHFRDCMGQVLSLKSFSPGDIYNFLTRWPFGQNVDQNIARIYAELTDHPTVREMCSNPLILSMYVAEDQASTHFAATETRTEFYKKVTEELIIRRRLRQTGPISAHSKIRENREKILGQIAYEHLINSEQPTNTIDWDIVINIIKDVMQCSTEKAVNVLNDISKETGLISEERVGQSIRFIHLTFCEYFAALEAIQGKNNGWRRLIDQHLLFNNDKEQTQLQSRIIEVIPFACGLLPRKDRDSAILEVSTIGNDILLSRCFLETKNYENPIWYSFIQRQKRYLLSVPESRWDNQWLRELHLFNIVVKDAEECTKNIVSNDPKINLDDFYKTLAANQKDSMAKLISAYANKDAAAAFRLAEVSNLNLSNDFPEIVISNCDQLPFLSLAINCALQYLNNFNIWAMLFSEAALRYETVAISMMKIESAPVLNKFLSIMPDLNYLTGESQVI